MANQKKSGKPELTAKQRRFVDEYLIDLNATQAAIRAGYSEKTAEVQGSRLLSNAKVRAAIQEGMQRREKRTEITQDRVLKELAKIGFADIRKAVRWGDGIAVKAADDDGDGLVVVNGVALVGSEQIDDDTAAAIAEISQGAQGVKVKFHDKRGALVDVGRHLGMFPSKVELTGKDGGPIELRPARELTDTELEAELKRLEGEHGQAPTTKPRAAKARTAGRVKKAPAGKGGTRKGTRARKGNP